MGKSRKKPLQSPAKPIKMKSLITLFFSVWFFTCLSQTLQPEFKFTVYAEDSRGHKDSVTIGYHHQAFSGIALDTRFPDKNISATKFDSVFEMRAHRITYMHNHYDRPILTEYGSSKYITLSYNNRLGSDTCVPNGFSSKGFLLIKIKYPPLKMSWDKKPFDRNTNPCVGRSYLLFNEYYTQEYPPEFVPFTAYLGEKSFLIDSLPDKPTHFVDGFPSSLNRKIRIKYFDGTMDTLQANYQFVFQNSSIRSPVRDIVSESITMSYPNPCRDQLFALLPEKQTKRLTVNIYSITGALLQAENKIQDNIVTIDTATLDTGNYILEIITSENKRFIGKFNKVKD